MNTGYIAGRMGGALLVLCLIASPSRAQVPGSDLPPDSQGQQAQPADVDGGEEAGGREEAAEEELNRAEMVDPFKPRYIVEAIEVRGNDKTHGGLVISHMLLEPGETLDEEKVQISRIRLLSLGYFRDVHMSLEKGSKRGRVKLVVEVEERNTIIIDDLFFGVSSVNPWWFGAGVSDINFLGRGLVLSGAVVASEHQQALRLGLFWPSIFNSRFQAGFDLLFSWGKEQAIRSRIGESDPAVGPCNRLDNKFELWPAPPYDDASNLYAVERGPVTLPYWRAGGTLTFGLRLDRVHRIVFDYHLEHITADLGEGSSCANHPFRGYIQDGQSTYSSFIFRFERDTRDDFFLPRNGMFLVVSVELSSQILGSGYEFSKYQIKYEQSFPAFLDHAVRISAAGGLIQDVGEAGVPFFSQFFVGDYAFFLIDKAELPRNLELNFSEVFDYGDVMFSASVEYDIPLWSTGKFFYRGYVYGAVNFSYVTKAAFLKSEDEEWSGRTKRPVSMDLGFKFDTPIGLFTFSIGYVFDLVL